MIDWKTKLTSRKFWMAIIGFVTGLLTYLGVGAEEAEQIGSLILMGASVLAYIIGEGLADAAGAKVAPFAAMQEAREKAPDWDQAEDPGEDLE